MTNKTIDIIANTPTIPCEIVATMPSIIKDACAQFNTNIRHRDVFLTSLLTVLSGSLPKVTGRYYTHKLYPNLYSVVVAGAGSGKSNALFAKLMGKAMDEERRKAFMEQGRKLEGRKWGQYLAANTSSARLTQQLSQNEGEGILFESEIDTLCNALSQDWGDYSANLREAYQHEEIKRSRYMDDVEIRIENPKVSMLLTGTIQQAQKLFPSVENGLFSRVTFYTFIQERKRISVKPKNIEGGFEEYFLSAGDKLVELASFLESNPTEIRLTEDQWNSLDEFLNDTIEDADSTYGEEAFSPSMRLGIGCFRIAMILTAIRKGESKAVEKEVFCSDMDLNTAKALAGVYMKHSMAMLQLTPQSNVRKHITDMESFANSLPFKFNRNEEIELGKKFKFSDSKIDRTLKRLVKEEYLAKPNHGEYSKPIKPSDNTDKS